MDEYMFKFFLDECRVVDERTSYVEIFNYSVSFLCFLLIYLGQGRKLEDEKS